MPKPPICRRCNSRRCKCKDGISLYYGDCWRVMALLDAESFTAVVTDPPYGLRFMNRFWDRGVPGTAFWQAMYRICKPGAPLLAFGGCRTQHRMVCAIEDAGWEICNQLYWLFGSGFPKATDISKAIDKAAGVEREVVGKHPQGFRADGSGLEGWQRPGHATHGNITVPATPEGKQWDGWFAGLQNLKPSSEPICYAQKPRDGTYADNALTHGVAGLNVDGCRVEHDEPVKTTERTADKFRRTHAGGKGWRGKPQDQKLASPAASGRWPANVIHDGSPEVLAGFPEARSCGQYPSKSVGTGKGVTYASQKSQGTIYSDAGSAARFFYTAKASKAERRGSKHPTVKPLALMIYLCKLVTMPANTIILDPFAGSGSTLVAAQALGLRCVGIEQDKATCKEAIKRLAKGPDLGLLDVEQRDVVDTNTGPTLDL